MIVKNDIDQIQTYLTDASGLRANISKVYIPQNIQELKLLIAELFSTKTPFTISGAGTGLTGGRSAQDGVMISTELLNKIKEVDYNNKIARVEPGVMLADLQIELSKNRCFFPPNPTEKNSTIGGNIALNASGSRTFKYGSYRNYVTKLDVVLANGDEISLYRDKLNIANKELTLNTSNNKSYVLPISDINMPDIKHSAGYFLKETMEPIDLFIGSEGTLGVITEAELKFETQPENVMGIIVFFDNLSNMLDFIEHVRLLSKANNQLNYKVIATISARLIELFDRNAINLIRDKYPLIPGSISGCVWIEQEYAKPNEDKILDNWLKIISNYTPLAESTWIAMDDNQRDKLTEFRHSIPLKVSEIMTDNHMRKVGTDTAVPDIRFNEFYRYVDHLFYESGIDFAIWGHVGNSHIHANLLPKSSLEFDKSLEIFNLIIDKCLFLGGTISAEHGVGKIKKEYLLKMFGLENVNKMKQIKQILDPYNLIGRGNLFD